MQSPTMQSPMQTPMQTPMNGPISSPKQPTQEQLRRRIERWKNAMQASHDLLLAGLRREVGPDGDLEQAYRDWYAENRRRHCEDLHAAHRRWLARQEKTDAT